MRRKRRPVGKPHLFLSVEPSLLGGCCIRRGVGPNDADEETTYPVFFVSSKLPSTPSGGFYNTLLAGRALRAKPEGVGSTHGHRHQRHAQAFSAKTWGPVAGTAIYATLKPSPQRRGVRLRAPPYTPRSSLLRKSVASTHGHCHIRHAQAFSAMGWRPVARLAINVTYCEVGHAPRRHLNSLSR